jgi:hypothetical protein
MFKATQNSKIQANRLELKRKLNSIVDFQEDELFENSNQSYLIQAAIGGKAFESTKAIYIEMRLETEHKVVENDH